MRRAVQIGQTGLPIDDSLPPVPQSAVGIPKVQQAHTTVFLEEWAKAMEKDDRRAEATVTRELIGHIRNQAGRRPNGEIAGRLAYRLLDSGQKDDALTISSVLDRMRAGNYAKQHHIDPFVARLARELLEQQA
jgi:hypothetical protein